MCDLLRFFPQTSLEFVRKQGELEAVEEARRRVSVAHEVGRRREAAEAEAILLQEEEPVDWGLITSQVSMYIDTYRWIDTYIHIYILG